MTRPALAKALSGLLSLEGLTCIFLVLVGVLGGASRRNAIPSLVIELSSLVVLVMAVRRLDGAAWRSIAIPFVLALAALAVPVLQLVPLPPEVWTALPGRGPMADHLRLAGLPLGWAPMTMAPSETMAGVLFLFVPIAMLLAAAAIEDAGRRWIAGTFVGVALASLGLGLIQLGQDPHSPLYFYSNANFGKAVGFFANRNHQATMMLCAVPMAMALALAAQRPTRVEARLFLGALVVFVLLAGLIAVQSRAGMLLAPAAVLGAIAVVMREPSLRMRRLHVVVVMALVAAAAVGTAAVVRGDLFDRFTEPLQEESRLTSAPFEVIAGRTYMPVGAGLGTFADAFKTVEPLELLEPTFLNNAHNDYMEIWIETGVVGPILVVLFLAWFLVRTVAVWRSSDERGATLARGASVVVVLILAHSTLDYPLRTPAMATVFAFACALLAPSPLRRRGARSRSKAPRPVPDI